MGNYSKYPGLDEVIAFHGHMCPGLAIGYRATMAAFERLDLDRSADEELVAIVENDSCSVDAVQYLAGATFGKGNLFFRDWGKQAFTIARRDSLEAVRVALKREAFEAIPGRPAGGEDEEAALRQQRIDVILDSPLEDLFDVREVAIEIPPRARIHSSVPCDRCGEPVMETRIVDRDGRHLCRECAAGSR